MKAYAWVHACVCVYVHFAPTSIEVGPAGLLSPPNIEKLPTPMEITDTNGQIMTLNRNMH